jgi:hypothetical protein
MTGYHRPIVLTENGQGSQQILPYGEYLAADIIPVEIISQILSIGGVNPTQEQMLAGTPVGLLRSTGIPRFKVCNPENPQDYLRPIGLILQTIEPAGQGEGWNGAAQTGGVFTLEEQQWISCLNMGNNPLTSQPYTSWGGWETGSILYHGDTPRITAMRPDLGWLAEIGVAVGPYSILLNPQIPILLP